MIISQNPISFHISVRFASDCGHNLQKHTVKNMTNTVLDTKTLAVLQRVHLNLQATLVLKWLDILSSTIDLITRPLTACQKVTGG